MKVGRNDPCPCGSGKKYKKCCIEADQRVGAGTRQRPELAGEARRTIAAAEEWEADVVPVPGSLGEDPTSRPGVVLVMAAGFVVHGDSLDRPSPEPEALAATLEAALTAAAEKAGLEDSFGDDPDGFVEREKEVLGRFRRHLATHGRGGKRGLAAPTVEKHWLNADTFIEFLAGHQGVPIRAVHEYDLRVFLHDWFHRKVVSSDSQDRAVPVSLERFFAFLAAEEGIVCPWARAVLADRDTYEARRASCPGHFFWEDEVQAWRAEEADDLGDHALLPDDQLGADDLWSFTMGPTEAALHHELERRWLLWRDQAIHAGSTDAAEVFEAAGARQHAWEAAPHPGLGGKSPYQVIRAERRAREAREHGVRKPRRRRTSR